MKIFDTRSVAALALGVLTVIGAPTFAQTQDANTTPSAASREQRRLQKRANADARNNAQARGGRGAASRFVRQLTLSPEQKQHLRPILKAAREQTRTIRQDTTMSREQKRQRIQEARASVQAQIEKILTPEQNRQLETLQQASAERRQDRSELRTESAKTGGITTQ
ncbi:MAG TPA: hypothetical protein VF600_07500 [Abditibacteriaceae bacterium]|jgi:Spy/CpxP family protein refolding chaperone